MLAQDNGRDVDVAGFSRQVLRCLAATDGIVECRTAVTGTDDDGLTGMVAQGFEYVLAQCLEVPYYGLVCFHRGVETVVDAVGAQRERRDGVATKTQGSRPVLFCVAPSVAYSNPFQTQFNRSLFQLFN